MGRKSAFGIVRWTSASRYEKRNQAGHHEIGIRTLSYFAAAFVVRTAGKGLGLGLEQESTTGVLYDVHGNVVVFDERRWILRWLRD